MRTAIHCDTLCIIFLISSFGVCCVFLVSDSGSNVNQNCTYIRNPGFPQAYAATTGVQYTINKCANSECKKTRLLGTADIPSEMNCMNV